MSLATWIGRKIGLADGGFWAAYFGGSTRSGRSMGPEGAMKLSAWFRGVKLYAEVGGMLPCKFYEYVGEDRKQARDHPAAEVVGLDPNAEQTTAEFWAGQFASLVTFGNAYAEQTRTGDGRLVSLEPLPVDTRPYRDVRTGALRYRFIDRGKTEELPVEKMLHTRGWGFGGDVGLSPIAYARESLALADAVEEAAQRSMANGVRGVGYFTYQGEMTDQQQKDFHKKYVKPLEGPEGESKSIVLPPQFDWKALNIAAKDMELIMQRRFSVEDVLRFLGIPPILVGHSAEGQTMWGSGVENIMLSWRVLGLDALLTFFEKSLRKRLLNAVDRRRFYFEFDRDALMQADSAARAAFIANQVQFGQMTPNEGRRKQNRLPGVGGDELMINSTLVPLRLAGRMKPARVQPAPGEPVPEDRA